MNVSVLQIVNAGCNEMDIKLQNMFWQYISQFSNFLEASTICGLLIILKLLPMDMTNNLKLMSYLFGEEFLIQHYLTYK